jgi:putative addiction module killer protein
MNVPVAELATISTPKGEYVSAKQVIRGRSAKEILEEVLPRTVAEIPWPRSMYWTGAEGLHFIRPIRWVVAMLGGKTLQLSLMITDKGFTLTLGEGGAVQEIPRKGPDYDISALFDKLKDVKGKQIILNRVDRLAKGNPGACRYLGEGLWELKVDFGPGYRVYFGQAGTKVVLLLCGGDKSTQTQDILQAKSYWKDYKKRTGHAPQ